MSLRPLLLLSALAAWSPSARLSATAFNPDVHSGSDFADQMVHGHNEIRAEVGAPPVRWNRDLARQAEDWAETNLRLGHLQHSAPQTRQGQGENLAAVYGGHVPAVSLLRGWASEREHYHGDPINCGDPTSISMIGHYTQVIWRRTTEIGCGTASNLDSQVLVCRYRPPGNVCGQTP